jgi:hypothetical protein
MPPRLPFLPGMDGTQTLFRDVADEVGNKYACIAVSYPSDEPLEYTHSAVLISLAGGG